MPTSLRAAFAFPHSLGCYDKCVYDKPSWLYDGKKYCDGNGKQYKDWCSAKCECGEPKECPPPSPPPLSESWNAQVRPAVGTCKPHAVLLFHDLSRVIGRRLLHLRTLQAFPRSACARALTFALRPNHLRLLRQVLVRQAPMPVRRQEVLRCLRQAVQGLVQRQVRVRKPRGVPPTPSAPPE